MRTPEQACRSPRSLALGVELLEGRRLPSVMIGPVSMSRADTAGTFVYTIGDYGGPRGPGLPPPPIGVTALGFGGRPSGPRGSIGDFLVAGVADRGFAGGVDRGFAGVADQGFAGGVDRGSGPSPGDKLLFTKLIGFSPDSDKVVRFDPRDGGGDGPFRVLYSQAPAVFMPMVKFDAAFVTFGAIKARMTADDSGLAASSRAQRETPTPDAPGLTETVTNPEPAPLPIAAAPETAIVPPQKAVPAAVAAGGRGVAGPVELPDRRAVAITDRADPAASAFRPSDSGETTAAALTLVPDGESVAVRPNDGVPVTRTTSRRVAYGGEDAAPEGAELLTHFLPLDRATLEVAIDRVFGQLASIAPELPDLDGPIDWASAAMTLLAAGIAADVAVRILNRYRNDRVEDDEEAGYVLFPGLPGGWKLEDR